MSAQDLVYGPPIVLFKGEPHRVLKHNKAAQAFQDSLQVGGSAVKLPKAKPCKICKEIKPLEMFSINASMKDNRINKCKDCTEAARLEKADKEKQRYSKMTRADKDHRNKNGTKNYKIRKGL